MSVHQILSSTASLSTKFEVDNAAYPPVFSLT